MSAELERIVAKGYAVFADMFPYAELSLPDNVEDSVIDAIRHACEEVVRRCERALYDELELPENRLKDDEDWGIRYAAKTIRTLFPTAFEAPDER